jgi:hypothetical protein
MESVTLEAHPWIEPAIALSAGLAMRELFDAGSLPSEVQFRERVIARTIARILSKPCLCPDGEIRRVPPRLVREFLESEVIGLDGRIRRAWEHLRAHHLGPFKHCN